MQAVAQAFTRLSVRALGSGGEPTASIVVSGASISAACSALVIAAVPSQRSAPAGGAQWGLVAAMGVMACGLQVS